MASASKLVVTIIGARVPRSPHLTDWHLVYEGFASQPSIDRRLLQASKEFTHLRVFANKKLIGERLRGSSETAAAIQTPPPRSAARPAPTQAPRNRVTGRDRDPVTARRD